MQPATAGALARRPRHTPQESEREILAAAGEVLRELPYREVTVEAIMCRTGLKRPAFYAHFRDRNEVVLRIVEGIGSEFLTAAGSWLGGTEESREALGRAVAGSVAVYARHAPILRALADAAPGDESVETAYRGLVESLAAVVAERIVQEQRRGAIDSELDAPDTARALVWMNERHLYEMLGRRSQSPEQVAATLQRIWLAALYDR